MVLRKWVDMADDRNATDSHCIGEALISVAGIFGSIECLGSWAVAVSINSRWSAERHVRSLAKLFMTFVQRMSEDSVTSRAGIVQPLDRVCIELKERGAHDFVELRA